ncbi:hypothetical protein [Sinomonas sp. ASV322]|uniref:hypothetical protein n=1 Tax=Sinomonas sp. ASV322 TaxID=3041920 RepID=UPI0027DCBA25|nr:hypothetical protein [Sinomonas sp. ASV322]MDQ4504056.1 hypothetical protein [Sinomonas sp. ASV322]
MAINLATAVFFGTVALGVAFLVLCAVALAAVVVVLVAVLRVRRAARSRNSSGVITRRR